MESSPGEITVKIIETTRDIEYYINLGAKAAGWFEVDSNFRRNSTVGKRYQAALHAREIIHERKSIDIACFIVVLRNCHSHPTLRFLQ